MTVLNRALGALVLSVAVAGTVAAGPAVAEPDKQDDGPGIAMKWMHFMGEPAEPTFTAVQADAVTFTYRLDGGPARTVPVGHDGSTTVRIDVPVDPSEHTVAVFSSAADGERSTTSAADLWVNRGTPTVDVLTENPVLGDTVEFEFASEQPGIESYTFWVGGGPRTTVPAGARAEWVAIEGGFPEVRAFGTTVDGYETTLGFAQLVVNDGRPSVSSAEYPEFQSAGGPGVSGTFHFASAMANVTEYRYRPFDGGPERTVAAAPDGTASVTLTPDRPGLQTLLVVAVNGDGLVSGQADYMIDVASGS